MKWVGDQRTGGLWRGLRRHGERNKGARGGGEVVGINVCSERALTELERDTLHVPRCCMGASFCLIGRLGQSLSLCPFFCSTSPSGVGLQPISTRISSAALGVVAVASSVAAAATAGLKKRGKKYQDQVSAVNLSISLNQYLSSVLTSPVSALCPGHSRMARYHHPPSLVSVCRRTR